jgi:hypothetical protein
MMPVLLRDAQNTTGCVVVLGSMNQIQPSSSALPVATITQRPPARDEPHHSAHSLERT